MEIQDALGKATGALSALRGIERVAKSDKKDPIRQKFSLYIPGLSRQLREAAGAIPILVAADQGIDKEGSISKQYGGQGEG